MSIHDKLNKLSEKYEKYTLDEEGLVEFLKKKFPSESKLAIKDLKDEGVEDPELELTQGRIADHITKSEDFLKQVEIFLKK